MKTEPELFSIDDLAAAPNQTSYWHGVRNYQARNFMRDLMQLGDRVLVYHSNATPSCVVGTATIARTSYPDHTAWDPKDPYFDPKSDPENPRWFMVDITLESIFKVPLSLADLRKIPELEKIDAEIMWFGLKHLNSAACTALTYRHSMNSPDTTLSQSYRVLTT